jgi:hydrophobic/amphiphilic exporter-1 (mainly G- bacteria), HAE1 family
MKITQFSVRNPLVVSGLAVALCLFGLFAYFKLGVATMPNLDLPSVGVVTIYPGADPETVETNVTKVIEDAIAGLPNIEKNGIRSVSSAGVSNVTVTFNDQANSDLISVDVQRVVNGVRGKLPSDAETPTVMKFDVDAFWGVGTVVISGQQPLVRLQDLAENLIQPKFNALPGVSSATVRSGVTREVHVLVDEDKLRSRGLSIAQVVGALQSQQLEVPAGTITQGTRDFNVYFDSLATSMSNLGEIVVQQTPAGAIYLRDVARLEDTTQKRSSIVRVDGHEGVALTIAKLREANSISVMESVKHAIEELEPQLPPNTEMAVVVDSSIYTEKSFHAVQNALVEAVLVTGVILLLFLHTWRSTLIVLVSIPISLLSTIVMMSLLGYNLNLMTMIALTVSVGILVDDSIVVLENIYRHLDMGKTPFAAALDGRAEIGTAAMTITLVDVVVYAPIAVMTTGVARQFLGPFALVITAATLASLAVSFTITPLLAKMMLRHGEQKQGNGPLDRFGRAWDRGFERLEHGYEVLLRASLPKRWLVIAVGLATFAGGIALPMYGYIGQDFFPSGDQSEIDVQITMPAATSLAATNAVTLAMEKDLRAGFPEVRSIYSIVGAGGQSSSTNSAQVAVLLVPPRERHRTAAQISQAVRETLGDRYPGASLRIGMPNAFGFGGFDGAPIQVQLMGSDPATLDALSAQVEAAVRQVPGAIDIRGDSDNRQTQLRATIDWPRAADLGVSARDAGIGLRTALDGFTANGLSLRQTGKASIPLRVQREGAEGLSPADLSRATVMGVKGPVELGQFTTMRQAQIPNSINRLNRMRTVTVGLGAGNGRLVGDVQKDVEAAVKQVPVPAGYKVSYGGAGEGGGESFAELGRALGVGVLLMYMLMMMLFGSVTRPLAVLMSLPLAVVGALGGLALTHNPFTIFSMLGVAVLTGLVGKNAILLVDYTNHLRQQGYSRSDALLKAGPTRLRPIVMTTVSVMAALLPIASGLEEGSELLVSVAVVLIGGLLTSTLLTLVFVPAMYTIFDDLERGAVWLFSFEWARRSRPVEAQPAAAPAPALALVGTPWVHDWTGEAVTVDAAE